LEEVKEPTELTLKPCGGWVNLDEGAIASFYRNSQLGSTQFLSGTILSIGVNLSSGEWNSLL
jgi:hypothetical protein